MPKPPDIPGTAVLDILVGRHQALLEARGQSLTRAEAMGRLLAAFLRFDRGQILAAATEALNQAGGESERALVQATTTQSTNGKAASCT